MSARDFDPRGKVNSALLVGVYRYAHAENMPGVRRNLGALFDALMNGGVFGSNEVEAASPATQTDFLRRLDNRLQRARGLFLLYFAGHGRLSQDGTDLFLACGDSERYEDGGPAYTEAVSWTYEVLPRLRYAAENGRVGQIVVILDCCYAGNALRSFGAGDVHLGRDRISVLTAVQVNRRIPAGSGSRPTPYTGQLVRLLHEGVEPGTNVIRVEPLALALRQAMAGRTTVEGDPWVPRHHRAETDLEVVLGLRDGIGDPWWRRLRQWLARVPAGIRGWFGDRFPFRTGCLAWSLVAAVLLAAAGGFGVYHWVTAAVVCAPPVQLRLMTDPDVRPTVQTAVDTYLISSANHDGDGCRRANISLFAPKSTEAVAGLQRSSEWQSPRAGDDFQPQRDLGPQPDVWIPGARVSLEQAANGQGPVTLTDLGSLAYTPLVLAVPRQDLPPGADAGAQALTTMIQGLRAADSEAVVLRADPESTDSAQLATVALYGVGAGEQPIDAAQVQRLEQQAKRLSPAPQSSYELMKELATATGDLESHAAVLLPEQVMAQFNAPAEAGGRLGVDTATLSARVPLYPADTSMLDLPFIQVTWAGNDPDAAARKAAVTGFHRWLVSPAGQRVFTDAGYRGADADHSEQPEPPATGSWLVHKGGALRSPPTMGYGVTEAMVAEAMTRYRQGPGPGHVLFLLDASTSMDDKKLWRRKVPQDLIGQSLAGLGPRDSYGIWTVVGSDPAVGHLVDFDPHASPAQARQALGSAALRDDNALPAEAVAMALNRLSGGDDGTPKLLVYVTDDEDDPSLKNDAAGLAQQAKAAGVHVDWVSMSGAACAVPDNPGAALAVGSGGRCLPGTGGGAKTLLDEVALVGTGDTAGTASATDQAAGGGPAPDGGTTADLGTGTNASTGAGTGTGRDTTGSSVRTTTGTTGRVRGSGPIAGVR